jgi:hypothetical protein
MDLLLLGLIALALLMVLLLIIYLVDRVNTIERVTQDAVKGLGQLQGQQAVPQGPFGALSGRGLWDAMTGESAEIDPMEASMMRQRYETVLQRHIEGLFDDGRKDGQAGNLNRPANTRRINTVRGAVESWMPVNQAQAIYQCGFDFSTQGPAQWSTIRSALDEVAADLFSKANMQPRSKVSDSLMGPDPDAEARASA